MPLSPDDTYEYEEEEDGDALEDFPTLKAVAQFTQMLRDIPWMHQAGEVTNSADRCLPVDYLAGLGFTDRRVSYLRSWEELAEIVLQLDESSDEWQEENRLFDNLITEALEQMEEADLKLAFAHIARAVQEVLPDQIEAIALQSGHVPEEWLCDALLGMAVRDCQMAASVLAAGAVDEEHPFATKFRLYECGHWPVGFIGSSFFVF